LKKKDEIFVRFYELTSDIEEKEGVEVTEDQVYICLGIDRYK